MTDLDNELTRIDDRDDVVRAWVVRHEADHVIAAHRAAPGGPLHGWTLGVKDVIDTEDLPTERGSPIYAGRRTANDAACVAIARRAGATVVGKTTTTEFALFTPTMTTNPHRGDHTPGGSSSGSAAAVADGMVRAAFGTQTVGSVIRPASYCGVVGFKPTHNLVPLAGIAGLSPSFDTLGWFTRSVADAATMIQSLAAVEPIAASKQPRVGVYRSHQWPSAEPEMADTLARAAARLRGGGFDVVTVDPLPHLDPVFQAADTILHFEVARVFAWERQNHWDLISPLVQRMLINADKVGAVEHARCRRVLEHARREHDAYLMDQGIDALVTPSAPGEAPPIKTTGDSVFNRTWTSLAVPAIHLPTGTGPTGLPVGVQLTGTRWGDAELLAVAADAELVLGSNE